MSDRLLDVCNARSGIVCTTGAGGKKTTLYRLAAAHGGRVALTATVTTLAVPPRYRDIEILAPAAELKARVLGARPLRRIAFAEAIEKAGRQGGIPPELIEDIHREGDFDVTLVKADGARMRLIKAPGTHEPRIPSGTATVIPVVSAHVIGQPLTAAIAHRPELIAAITGAEPGEALRPIHLARLIASSDGALRGTGTAQVVPVINMVDDAGLKAAAHEAARQALSLTARFDRVVLACMTADDPIVAVVGSEVSSRSHALS